VFLDEQEKEELSWTFDSSFNVTSKKRRIEYRALKREEKGREESRTQRKAREEDTQERKRRGHWGKEEKRELRRGGGLTGNKHHNVAIKTLKKNANKDFKMDTFGCAMKKKSTEVLDSGSPVCDLGDMMYSSSSTIRPVG
jgi:hypothetical protein